MLLKRPNWSQRNLLVAFLSKDYIMLTKILFERINMPIKSISYSKFTSERDLRSDLKQGRLEGSDKHWHAELLQHEDATRAKLLSNELLRFFCNSRQPSSLIAYDKNHAFYLLTEINTAHKTRYDLIEKDLISKAVNIFLPNQDAIEATLNYYVQAKTKAPLLQDFLNQIMLRLILLPKSAMSFFVKAYLEHAPQKDILDKLALRQSQLIEQLLKHHDFKTFLLSDQCAEERQKSLDVLKTFKIHDGTGLMNSFSVNTINDFHALQWQEIHFESRDDFMISLEETFAEEVATTNESPFLYKIDSDPSSPDLPDMTIIKRTEQIDASPVCVANNPTPELPLVEVTYALNGGRNTPSKIYSFFSTPMFFLRAERGSPMSLSPENFNGSPTLVDSLFRISKTSSSDSNV